MEINDLDVMVDPSLLASENCQYRTLKLARELHQESGKTVSFYLPSSFLDLLRRGRVEDPVFRFFAQGARPSPYEEILKGLEGEPEPILAFRANDAQKERHNWFYNSLREIPKFSPNDKSQHGIMLADILFEEWIFLQDYSWIVSRLRKSFDRFKAAGATCIEYSKRAIDILAKKALKKKGKTALTNLERFKGIGRWVAGGASIFSPFEPILGALAGLWELMFLLFDP